MEITGTQMDKIQDMGGKKRLNSNVMGMMNK